MVALPSEIFCQQRIQFVIAANAIDFQIAARRPFMTKSVPFEKPDGPCIFSKACSFQPLHSKIVEKWRQDGCDRPGHVALTGMAFTHPVAKRGSP